MAWPLRIFPVDSATVPGYWIADLFRPGTGEPARSLSGEGPKGGNLAGETSIDVGPRGRGDRVTGEGVRILYVLDDFPSLHVSVLHHDQLAGVEGQSGVRMGGERRHASPSP